MSSRAIAGETSGELLQKESLTLTLYENAAACCKKGLKITLQQTARVALAIADQEKLSDLSGKKYLTAEP